MRQRHKQLANAIRVAAQREFGRNVRLFERHAGLMQLPGGGYVKPFTDGQADLYGWLRVNGRAMHVEIELKVGKDDLRPDQKDWRKVCEDGGVLYLVVKTNDVMDGVEQALSFLRGAHGDHA